jgi:dihydropteroate synthase
MARHVAGTPNEGRCLVMGIVNVTPDSFSDGGRWLDPAAAVRQGLAMLEQGADILDVGGESTRPGARRPSAEDECRRVLPVVEGLARAGAFVSVDTMRASVAAAALQRGARMINDVSGGLADPEMLRLVARADVPYVLMHWRAHADVMTHHSGYRDVVEDVLDELTLRVSAAEEAGMRPGRLVLDPGLGFAKEVPDSWRLLADLERVSSLGFPVLVGASRKRFLAEASLPKDPDADPDASQRDLATAAVSAFAATAGAWCVRVHDPRASAHAVRVAARLAAAHEGSLAPC